MNSTNLYELLISYVPTGVSLITFIVVGFSYLTKLKSYISKSKLESYTETNEELVKELKEYNQLLIEQNNELREMNNKLTEELTHVKINSD